MLASSPLLYTIVVHRQALYFCKEFLLMIGDAGCPPKAGICADKCCSDEPREHAGGSHGKKGYSYVSSGTSLGLNNIACVEGLNMLTPSSSLNWSFLKMTICMFMVFYILLCL